MNLFIFQLQRIPVIEEQLGKLVTDDPSVIESSLENFSDLVYPDKTSVLNRCVLLSHLLIEIWLFLREEMISLCKTPISNYLARH